MSKCLVLGASLRSTLAADCRHMAGAIPAGILDARHIRGWARGLGWRAG